MAVEIELELTYLARVIPDGVTECENITIEDMYFPAGDDHPKTRIRKKGDDHQFTRKIQIDPNDAGQQEEHNVPLTAAEYDALAQGNGRRVSKSRYYLPYGGRIAEVDVFSAPLDGLVVIEFEFDNVTDKAAFEMPTFCLADVTQEAFIAGGKLAGKTYQDIQQELERFDYKPLYS